jgi:hypothetical protein
LNHERKPARELRRDSAVTDDFTDRPLAGIPQVQCLAGNDDVLPSARTIDRELPGLSFVRVERRMDHRRKRPDLRTFRDRQNLLALPSIEASLPQVMAFREQQDPATIDIQGEVTIGVG